MLEEIESVQAQGFKPAIYIEECFFNTEYIAKIRKKARQFNIPIFSENNLEELHRLKKAYLFRYGYLSQYSEAFVKRKGGKIVSGNLEIE